MWLKGKDGVGMRKKERWLCKRRRVCIGKCCKGNTGREEGANSHGIALKGKAGLFRIMEAEGFGVKSLRQRQY